MEVEEKEGEFDWDQNERALILGSYYYGYTFMQVFFSLKGNDRLFWISRTVIL